MIQIICTQTPADLAEVLEEYDLSTVLEAVDTMIRKSHPEHHTDPDLTACLSYLNQAQSAALDAEKYADDWEIAA